MSKEPQYVSIDSEWITVNSFDDYPTRDSVVIKAEKLIGTQGGYELKIKKVIWLHGPTYMISIFSGGTGCNSETISDYDLALEKGKSMIHEMVMKDYQQVQEILNNFVRNK